LLIGNSGVGKSVLCNLILGVDYFHHDCSAGSVTTGVECEEATIKHQGKNCKVALFNIPGLLEVNEKNFQRNKDALTDAFSRHPRHVTVFVFNSMNGRLLGQDVEAFKTVWKTYALEPSSLICLFNQAKPTKKWQVEVLMMLEQESGWTGPLNALFLPPLPTDDDNKIDLIGKVGTEARLQLLAAIQLRTPKPHPKTGELSFKSDEIKAKDAAIGKLAEDIKKNEEKFAEKRKEMTDSLNAAQASRDAAVRDAANLQQQLQHARQQQQHCHGGGGGGGGCVIL